MCDAGISRNELADPGILGINAGAGLMVMLFISFSKYDCGSCLSIAGACIDWGEFNRALICVLAYKKNQGFKPTALLTGIAVAAGISAAMIVLTRA